MKLTLRRQPPPPPPPVQAGDLDPTDAGLEIGWESGHRSGPWDDDELRLLEGHGD
jgi:hypothetical protein